MQLNCFTTTVMSIVILSGFVAAGQTATGSISGVVQDESGAILPEAKITVTDVDTGIRHNVITDATGRYRVPSLIPDRYELQVERAGFQTAVRKGIQLTVGSDLEINMQMQVGSVSQQTIVTSEAPMVETLTGTVSGLVNDKEIRELPLNGRSFDQLITLQSSAVQGRYKTANASNGVGAGYSVHGARDQQNKFLLDGQLLLSAGNGTTLPGGALGVNLGVDAIREFSVLTSNYGAAYGRKSGAIVNMATRSGANQFSGSAFEFLRNSDLDARNFFDKDIPPFRRNQFGGTFGGPIRKDKTFFFGSYEGLRQNLGLSVVETVPDNNARQGLVPVNGTLTNIGLAAAVKPYLSTYPLANGRNFGDGTAEAIFSPSQVSKQNFYLGRLDYQLSAKDSLFGRYTYTDAETFGSSGTIYWAQVANSTNQDFLLGETRVFSSTTVNSVRVGVNRSTLYFNALPTVPVDPALRFFPTAGAMGAITFSASAVASSAASGGALSATGPPASPVGTYAFTEFSYADDLSYNHGDHSLQFGIQVSPDRRNGSQPNTAYGAYQFANLTSFLQGKPLSFSAPNPTGGNDPTKSFQQTFVAAYVQDDYKVRRNLTLNLGLRWEFMSVPTEKYNRISNYRVHLVNGVSVVDSTPTLGSPYYASRKKNFAPRLGFAWDIFGDGKTALRGGFGIFYDQIETEYGNATNSNLPFFGLLQVANPPFPSGFSGTTGTSPLAAPGTIDPNLNPATRIAYNLNIQRQVTPSIAITVGYVGASAYHLTVRSDLNTVVPQLSGGVLFYPSTALRINPALASSQFISSAATSSYQGIETTMMQRLSHGLRWQVAFTYSKSIDDASDTISSQAIGSPTFATLADNLKFDRGLSSFDVRRNLVANMTYDLPSLSSMHAVEKWFGGWQLSGIATVADGMPFTVLTGFNRAQNKPGTVVDRPNLVAGKTYSNVVLGGPDKYFDPSAFALPPAGFFGNVGRNTLIGPGFADLDTSLTKVFPIGERLKLNFRAEVFNLLNRANFGLPSNTVFASSGAVQGNVGRITSTVSTSRQIQFGLKLLF